MTISIPTVTKGTVLAYRHEDGFILNVDGRQAFITAENAARLAYYFVERATA